MAQKIDEMISRERQVCAPIYDPLPVVVSKGEGVWLWDQKGNRYLDMMSAYSAMSFGHCNPRLLQVLTHQAGTLSLTSRAYYTDQLGPFLEKACELSGLTMGIPMNTGVEAVETGIKVARRWGYEVKKIPEGKAEIIVAEHCFHGRTLAVTGLLSNPAYRKDFGPFVPGFKAVPFGEAEALEAAITPHTCAFLVEPIQGEAGVIVPPEGWLTTVGKICKQQNVLLMVDEIQSGLGRTGKRFAFQHEKVTPDILLLGKALGGGFLPVSLVLGKREILSLMTPGSHGSTFGGNPLACAVGLAALTLLEEEKLAERSAELGAYMLKRLKAIPSPLIRAVRGKGLWAGIEFDSARIKGRTFCERLMAHHVLSKEIHDSTVRLAPPLVISQEDLAFGLDAFEATLAELEKEPCQG